MTVYAAPSEPSRAEPATVAELGLPPGLLLDLTLKTLFYQGRYSNTDLNTNRIPDFPKLAEAMGCVGLRAEEPADVDAVIEKANSINDVPVVVDFVVHKDAMVWPMVAAGTSNDEIKVARDMAPAWDQEEL